MEAERVTHVVVTWWISRTYTGKYKSFRIIISLSKQAKNKKEREEKNAAEVSTVDRLAYFHELHGDFMRAFGQARKYLLLLPFIFIVVNYLQSSDIDLRDSAKDWIKTTWLQLRRSIHMMRWQSGLLISMQHEKCACPDALVLVEVGSIAWSTVSKLEAYLYTQYHWALRFAEVKLKVESICLVSWLLKWIVKAGPACT